MNNEDKKRVRGANFSETEKNCLADIINTADVKSVIENKQQNGPTNKEKDVMWEKITLMFNANQQVRARTSSQLKQCYNNLKRQVKSNIANDRLQKFATGSGPYSQPKTSEAESKVYEVIRKQVQPLNNAFDTDAVFHGDTEQLENDDFEPSIVENISITTTHIDRPLVSTDTKNTDDPPITMHNSQWLKRNRPSLNKSKKTEAAKARESISILSNKRADLLEVEKQGLIKKQLLEQEVWETKIENVKKKSRILDLKIQLFEKQIEAYK